MKGRGSVPRKCSATGFCEITDIGLDEEFMSFTGFSLRLEPTNFVGMWRFYRGAGDVSGRDESHRA
jgi:hypothetical protein